MRLSAINRDILNLIQEDIPLVSNPWEVLAKKLGISEEEFIKNVKDMKEEGIIRTFGAGLSHKNLGFTGTLVSVKIDTDKVDEIAENLSKHTEVTHCYLREGEFNLYFVLICPNEEKMKEFLERLAEKVGRENIKNLVTKKQYKLKTRFKI